MKRQTVWEEGGLNAVTPLGALRYPGYRKLVFPAMALELYAAIATALTSLAQKLLIDYANAAAVTSTVVSAGILAFLMISTWGSRTGSYLVRCRLGMEANCQLKSAVFLRLLGMPRSLIQTRGSGYFFNRLQSDVTTLTGFFATDALQQLSDCLKLLAAIAVMLFLNWKVVVLALPFLVWHALIYRRYRVRQYRLGHRIQERTATERYRMQEFISGAATLTTHNAEEAASQQIRKGFSRWRAIYILRLLHENRFNLLLKLPVYCCCGGIACWGLYQVLHKMWSLGECWALLSLVRQLFGPSQRIALAWFRMQNAVAAWHRLRQLCSESRTDAASQSEQELRLSGDIEFKDVTFAYQAEQPLLANVNLKIPHHSVLLLHGENGSGKSTLLLLLLRLYAPQGGKITVGGQNIDDFPLKNYRDRIGYLGQTPEFFPGTVRDNLRLGNEADDAHIQEVLKFLQSEEFVARHGGLDAQVTEQAGNFSGGEKLRLALARELLRNTDILLLDEPAASLDPEARHRFYELLPRLSKRATVLAIVHDQTPISADVVAHFELHRA